MTLVPSVAGARQGIGVITRNEAISTAGRVLATGLAAQASMTPRQQAEAAYEPTCGLTVNGLEDLIRNQRGLPALHRQASA